MPDDKTKTKTPTMPPSTAPSIPPATVPPSTKTVDQQAAEFLQKVKELGSAKAALEAITKPAGRIIFAMDATSSRESTWELARNLQLDMFHAAAGLEVQLVYFRGVNECRHSKWVSQPSALEMLMGRIGCVAGYTQIQKVLEHAHDETGRRPVNALVYVGDSFEENIDLVVPRAREAGMPVFVFQEKSARSSGGRIQSLKGGDDDPNETERAFRAIAKASGGAYFLFDEGSADQLRQLLGAVAVYATQGTAGLEAQVSAPARLLLTQIKK
jgi:hypothetical protein